LPRKGRVGSNPTPGTEALGSSWLVDGATAAWQLDRCEARANRVLNRG
jgi:hypothetical protein